MRTPEFRTRRWLVSSLLAMGVLSRADVHVASKDSGSGVRLTHVYALKPDEGVYAYSRISPDGTLLAYASESGPERAPVLTVNVVDLATRQVRFADAGIDAYWANDGDRMIFLSRRQPTPQVTIRHQRTGRVVRGVVDPRLGDYYSWGMRDGQDVILTIDSNYFYLRGDSASSISHVPCGFRKFWPGNSGNSGQFVVLI